MRSWKDYLWVEVGEAAKLHGKDGILNGSRWFDKIYKVAGIGIKFLRGGMMNREEVERMQDMD